MHGLSTVDGFVEVNECLVEMIKYVANEPSVGLFYVQQHTQNAVPNLIHLKDKVVERSHETTLHTEDFEDSITMVHSMKECGLPIVGEMVKDIKKSLLIISTSQPQRGLIRNPSLGFQNRRSNSLGPAAFDHRNVATPEDRDGSGYFSTVLKTAKQRAGSFRWPRIDPKQAREKKGEISSSNQPRVSISDDRIIPTLPDMEVEELPLSSQILGESLEEPQPGDGSSENNDLSLVKEDYSVFKADREAKLEEWLGEMEILK